MAVACGAEMVLQSTSGSRTVAAEDFFTGTLETAAEANELLVEVRVPQAPAGQGAGFHEVSARKGDFAYVAVGATLQVADGACTGARIACAGVGDGPHRARAAEDALTGAAPGDDAFRQAAAAAADSIDPGEDFHADADYRRDLVRSLTRRALADAASRCN